ncbi:hypothetical protein [Leeuwenhoekiella marinoflava]|uniref:hypothetical protein n=1 Tax=Leeuwenhoekiella marinoflava TaxID=988 RepID=UPI003001B14A
MTTQLQLPPQFALQDALYPLTEALFERAAVEALYLTEINGQPQLSYHLLIVIAETTALNAVRKQLPVLQAQFPAFTLQAYTQKQLRAGLQAAELYFLRFGGLDAPVYTQASGYRLWNPQEGQLSTLLQKAEEQLDLEAVRIGVFFDTAWGLFEQENYPAACLALVEVFKSVLTWAHQLYTGQVQSGISLEAQVAGLSPYLPQLRVIFPGPATPDAEPSLLELLDVWGSEGFDPSEQLDRRSCYQVQLCMERVFYLVDQAARELLDACEAHHTLAIAQPEDRPEGAAPYAPLETGLQEALLFLQKTYRVHSAYQIYGEQQSRLRHANLFMQQEAQEHQNHAVVVLITHKAIGMRPSQLADRVLNATGRRIRITFILETFKRAYKALNYSSNFLQQVIGKGKVLFEEDAQLREFLRHGCFYHPQQFHKLKTYWDIRINRAAYLMEVTRTLDTHEDELVQLQLYQEALIQTCLGMIRLFWEYSPAYTSLPYLLDLCRSFTGFPQELLETTSFKARRRLYLLTHAQQHLRYGTFCKVTYDDATDSYHLCERFIKKAGNLAAERLLLLKRQTYQRAV